MNRRLWGRLEPVLTSLLGRNHLPHSPSHFNIKIQNFSFSSISLRSFLLSNLKCNFYFFFYSRLFPGKPFTLPPKKSFLAPFAVLPPPPPSFHHYQLLYCDFLCRAGIRLIFSHPKKVPLCTGIKRSLGVIGANLTPIVGRSFFEKTAALC